MYLNVLFCTLLIPLKLKCRQIHIDDATAITCSEQEPGIEPATIWFIDDCSTNRATAARVPHFNKILSKCLWDPFTLSLFFITTHCSHQLQICWLATAASHRRRKLRAILCHTNASLSHHALIILKFIFITVLKRKTKGISQPVQSDRLC